MLASHAVARSRVLAGRLVGRTLEGVAGNALHLHVDVGKVSLASGLNTIILRVADARRRRRILACSAAAAARALRLGARVALDVDAVVVIWSSAVDRWAR